MMRKTSILWSDRIVEEIQSCPMDVSQAGAAQWKADLIEAVKQYNLRFVAAIRDHCPISSICAQASMALRLM